VRQLPTGRDVNMGDDESTLLGFVTKQCLVKT
jgi:hypothetical protein